MIDKSICPLCGGKNNCHAAASEGHENCWCMTAEIPKEILDKVPDEIKGKSCICEKCVEKYKHENMRGMIDLHIHTTASDGTLTPSQVVESAYKNNVKVIAITDHDTVDGIPEARKKADDLGVTLIEGIEFSCDLQEKEVHILGYFLNLQDKKFLSKLEELKEERIKRNEKILEKLNKYNLDITMEDLENEASGGLISRAHIANVILKKGYAYSKSEVFKRYLGIHGKAYVPKENLSPAEAVRLIKENGGLAALAHPKYVSEYEERLGKIINELKNEGLDAIEVYYAGFSYKEVKYYGKIAKKFDLIATGGSDFHGGNREGIHIGNGNVPFSAYEELLELKDFS